jgi:predicted kinase
VWLRTTRSGLVCAAWAIGSARAFGDEWMKRLNLEPVYRSVDDHQPGPETVRADHDRAASRAHRLVTSDSHLSWVGHSRVDRIFASRACASAMTRTTEADLETVAAWGDLACGQFDA